jgi:hypothetical protein
LLVAILAASGALSLHWAVRTPFFQEVLPDLKLSILLHDDDLQNSGFTVEIPTEARSEGLHEAAFFLTNHAQTRTYPTTVDFPFYVDSASTDARGRR